MTIKTLINNSYGADIFKHTNELKMEKMKKAKLKNQITFLKKCITHRIIPKSMRIKSPLHTRRATNITSRYRQELLICAKNDAKSKFFQTLKTIDMLTAKLNNTLSREHMNIIKSVTNKAETKSFFQWKNHLKSKFDKLKTTRRDSSNVRTTIKTTTLNLCDDVIPVHHRELLDLGPKFVPTRPKIPYMDIIAKTESTALKIKYEKKEETTSMK